MSISSVSVLVFVETKAVVGRVVFVVTLFFAVKGSGSGGEQAIFSFNEVEVAADGSGSGGEQALSFDVTDESGTGGGWVLFFGETLEEEDDETID